jgi:hypothetical protein
MSLRLAAAPLNPGSTTLLTVTDTVAVAIIANTACGVVTVREDSSVAGWPSTDFQIRRPASGSTANQYPTGTTYAFTSPAGNRWAAGQIVGYIQLPASGSTDPQWGGNAPNSLAASIASFLP